MNVSPYRNNTVLHRICEAGAAHLTDLFHLLEVDFKKDGKRFVGRCPVHGGGSQQGCRIYPEGYGAKGNWYCDSNHCHTYFSSSLIGFVRGVLSHKKGWEEPTDKRISHTEAVNFLLKFLGKSMGDFTKGPQDDNSKFIRDYNKPKIEANQALCSNDKWNSMMQCPPQYYLDRGFRPETLKHFQVGLCVARQSREYGRIIIPVHDMDGRIIGGISRSTLERCEQCRLCHDEPPCPTVRFPHLRWRCIGEFNDKLWLYNFWRARAAIQRLKCSIVVEGASDLWRLCEAGFENAIALFGSDFHDMQAEALEGCIMNELIVLTDNDDAGNEAAERIARHFKNLLRVTRVLPTGKDVGEMSVSEIRSLKLERYFSN